MPHNVFTKTLRDQARALVGYGLGLVALAAYVLAVYPTIRDNPDLNRTLQNLPDAVKSLIGGSELDLISPAGYLNSELFALIVPLLLLIYAINLGAGAIAGEEERGTLDLLLAHPVGRGRIVAEKFLAFVVAVGVLSLVLWLALVAGAASIGMGIGAGKLATATAGAALLGLLFGALALAVGCATGRRGLTVGVCAAVAVAAYFLQSLAPLVKGLRPYRVLSPFYYYLAGDPLRNGPNVAHAVVLLIASALLLAVALVTFNRRDLSV